MPGTRIAYTFIGVGPPLALYPLFKANLFYLETLMKSAKGNLICCFSALLLLLGVACGPASAADEQAIGRKLAQQAIQGKELWITADHSKHQALKQDFSSGPEVTEACLSCHSEAASQFHETIHRTWMDPATEDSSKLNKGGLSINNF